MGYCLRAGISYCAVGDRLIFLDLNRDRYLCLPGTAERSFLKLRDNETPGDEDRRMLRGICGSLLVESDQTTDLRSCMAPPSATTSLVENAPGAIDARDVLAAFGHLTRAGIALKLRSLRRVLEALAISKSKRAAQSRGSEDGAYRVASAFQQLTLIATPLDKCLPRSIAAASRCIALGVPPTVVIGVKLQPFVAHCWVQVGQAIVNERVDGIREFTPILVI